MDPSFSWTDTIRACLSPCFPSTNADNSNSTDDAFSNPHRALTQNADLDRLLASDSETDALSLHTNPGEGPRRKRRRPRKNITLFGFNLFGRTPPPVALAGEDDALHRPRRRQDSTQTQHSTSTFDSDAPLLSPRELEEMDPAELAAQAERALAMQEEERKLRRARKKEMKKFAAQLAAANGSGEFEGFQGSGDVQRGHQKIPSPFMHPESTYSGGSDAHSSPTTVTSTQAHLPLPRADEDEADLDGAMYSRPTRRRGGSRGSRSNSDSQSQQSHSRGSASNPPRSPLSQEYAAHPPMSPFPSAPPLKEKRRKSKSKSKSSVTSSGSTASSSSVPPKSPTTTQALSPHVEEFDGTPGGFEGFDGTMGGFGDGELREMSNPFAGHAEEHGFAKAAEDMPSTGLLGGPRGRRVSDAVLHSGGF